MKSPYNSKNSLSNTMTNNYELIKSPFNSKSPENTAPRSPGLVMV